MENEEKNTFAGSQPDGLRRESRDMETAAEKYEDFAIRPEGAHLSFLSGGEGAQSEDEFTAVPKKRLDLGLLLRDKKKAAAVFLLLVLAAFGAFHFLDKKEAKTAVSVESESPIISAAMKAMREVQSYSYAGTMSFKRSLNTGGKEYGMDYQIIYNGVADRGAQSDPSAYSSLVYDTVRSAGDSKRETSIGLESVAIGGKRYLKLDNILVSGSDKASKAAVLEEGLKDYGGSWYFLSEESYESFYAEVKDYAFLPANLDLLDVESVDDFNEVFDHKLLTSAQDLGAEAVGEIEATHYKAGLNAQGALELVSSLASKQADQKESDEMTKVMQELQSNAQEAEKFKKMVDYVMQNVSIEIWIGKNDNLIHRFRISGNYDGNAIRGFYAKLGEIYGGSYASGGENMKDESMSFDIDYTLTGFNSAKVREPQGAKDFTEVMNRLKSANPEMAAAAASANAVDSDSDGLGDEQEKIYGSDPRRPDTDGDGYKDGDEVKAGYDPIVAGSARLDYAKLNKAK